ncbi:MAG: DUF2268 domain-containing putative Zn-dependent protease [Acidobacteriota bacterium]
MKNRIAFTFAIIFLLGLFLPAEAASEPTITERILDRHKVINIVDDFLAFWDKAEGKPLKLQRRLWRLMVESKHQNYFDRAVYGNATAEERRALLDEFLSAVPQKIESIRRLNSTLLDWSTNPIIDALIKFRSSGFFVNYKQPSDIYFGLSLLQFDGTVRAVGNDFGIPDTLCLGADVLADYKPEQLRVAIIHEFFHLYHFSFLLQHPDWFDIGSAHARLMIEGLAVAATEITYMNQPPFERSLELYLNFSEKEIAAQEKEMESIARRYLDLIRADAPREEYEVWFADIETLEAPPRGGYLLGYKVVKRLLSVYRIDELMRMSPVELRERAEEQLSQMSGDQVLLFSGDRD